MRFHKGLGIALAFAMTAWSCSRLAVWSAPDKTPSAERTSAALRADTVFWQTLHGGAYEKIPVALTALKGAYLENPNDAVTAAHVGWMHLWRLAERPRLDSAPPDPGITDDAALARKYFEEAVRLNPREPRYLGFYASCLLTEGAIHKDEKLRRRGYYTMLDAIAAWPEFNYFTAGYSFSGLPHDSERYREAVEFQWRSLDVCVEEKVDRANPDFAKYMRLETQEGPNRVCWNSWIAPHNFEGFFLNFGDMLVKAGDPATAVKMYRNAQQTRTYASWSYKDVLEARIQTAAQNVTVFRAQNPPPGAPAMMGRSRFTCTVCHQQ
jgi:hypothetical protein